MGPGRPGYNPFMHRTQFGDERRNLSPDADWEGCAKITSKVNFAKIDFTSSKHMVNFGGSVSSSREVIVFTPNSPTLDKYYRSFIASLKLPSSATLSPSEILAALEKFILEDQPYNDRAIESKSESTVQRYNATSYAALREGQPPKLISADQRYRYLTTEKMVPLEQFMQEKSMVCRHRSILSAYLMGRLIQDKYLPKDAEVYNYRSVVPGGAHVWSIYKQGSEVYLFDMMWGHHVKISDPAVYNLYKYSYGEENFKTIFARLNLSNPTEPRPVTPPEVKPVYKAAAPKDYYADFVPVMPGKPMAAPIQKKLDVAELPQIAPMVWAPRPVWREQPAPPAKPAVTQNQVQILDSKFNFSMINRISGNSYGVLGQNTTPLLFNGNSGTLNQVYRDLSASIPTAFSLEKFISSFDKKYPATSQDNESFLNGLPINQYIYKDNSHYINKAESGSTPPENYQPFLAVGTCLTHEKLPARVRAVTMAFALGQMSQDGARNIGSVHMFPVKDPAANLQVVVTKSGSQLKLIDPYTNALYDLSQHVHYELAVKDFGAESVERIFKELNCKAPVPEDVAPAFDWRRDRVVAQPKAKPFAALKPLDKDYDEVPKDELLRNARPGQAPAVNIPKTPQQPRNDAPPMLHVPKVGVHNVPPPTPVVFNIPADKGTAAKFPDAVRKTRERPDIKYLDKGEFSEALDPKFSYKYINKEAQELTDKLSRGEITLKDAKESFLITFNYSVKNIKDNKVLVNLFCDLLEKPEFAFIHQQRWEGRDRKLKNTFFKDKTKEHEQPNSQDKLWWRTGTFKNALKGLKEQALINVNVDNQQKDILETNLAGKEMIDFQSGNFFQSKETKSRQRLNKM